MTYILSKLFWTLFRPMNLTLLLIFVGILLQKAPSGRLILRRTGNAMLAFSFLVVVMFGFTNLPDYMLYKIENEAKSVELPENPAGIIVLGGGLNTRITRQRNINFAMSDAGERIIAGFELSNRYPGVPLIYSGGHSLRAAKSDLETDVAKNITRALYGDTKQIIVENKSRNTWENAVFTKELLKPKPGDKWIVITSAFHAARASAIFDRVGFEFVLYPTDYRAAFNGKFRFAGDALSQFKKADLVLKELIGIIAYTLTGRIDWPF